MPLEDLEGNKYISDLNPGWPAGTDFPDAGDNHIRGVKNVLLRSFPNISGPMTATQDELNTVTADIQQNTDDIAARVKIAGDSMTGALATPQVSIPNSTLGPAIYSQYSSKAKADLVFRTGTPTTGYNYVRIGEAGGINCKQITFRPDTLGDSMGPFINCTYYTAGTYAINLVTGNGSSSYPYKTFVFGQGGNASFPGDLTVAGKISAAGGINLALSGEVNYAVRMDEAVIVPAGVITYMALTEEAGKPVIRFGHRPLIGVV